MELDAKDRISRNPEDLANIYFMDYVFIFACCGSVVADI